MMVVSGEQLSGEGDELAPVHIASTVICDEEARFGDSGLEAVQRVALAPKVSYLSDTGKPSEHLNRGRNAAVAIGEPQASRR